MGKVEGYKINKQKSTIFLYTDNKISAKEIYLIQNSFKANKKTPGNKFNHKSKKFCLMKAIRLWWKNQKKCTKGKIPHVHGLEELKYPYYQSYRKIQCNLHFKKAMAFFTEIEKKILKFVRNHKKTQVAIAIMRKKTTGEGITLLDFKPYHKALIIKTVSKCHKKRIGMNGIQSRAQN